MPTPRINRALDQLRDVTFERGYVRSATGSVLIRAGGTAVICTASIAPGVPDWMTGKGRGWLTAEYAMLPTSTTPRKKRDRGPSLDGRSTEIQRLIGRSLRAVIDFKALGEATIVIDCDVLEADGGTRTASITGICRSGRCPSSLRENYSLRSLGPHKSGCRYKRGDRRR